MMLCAQQVTLLHVLTPVVILLLVLAVLLLALEVRQAVRALGTSPSAKVSRMVYPAVDQGSSPIRFTYAR